MAHVWELSRYKSPGRHDGNDREDADEDAGQSFADRALRETTQLHHSRYIALDWIPSTSNEVERLFSRAGLVFTVNRRAMHG
ncbi:hypothetical protein L914_06985 [Phytophthora nicotianae]|uniref:HAT C-terminal dimerisation domain-containing protein n=1 Tax=Phytophthora nicotianae TaxID=4792 RepID=W2NLC5_PHYNI|nr:hypothetical protein L914_06985 [Phytophthora nicotianae]